MELIGYLGTQVGPALTPEVVTNLAIGLAVAGGIVVLLLFARR